jgi:Rrf2 family protein
MLDLALHESRAPVLRQDIAERQALSADYIAQIFRDLTRAGFVRSVMGPGGGYHLAKDASTISVGEILRAVEGPISAVYCVDPHNQQKCPRMEACATHLVWVRLSRVIDQFLDSITLAELCEQSRCLQAELASQASPVEEMIQQLSSLQPPPSSLGCSDLSHPPFSRSN